MTAVEAGSFPAVVIVSGEPLLTAVVQVVLEYTS